MSKPLYSLYFAALECPHSIDSNRIVLHYDAKQPGHNALNQLARRLEAAHGTTAQEATPSAAGIEALELAQKWEKLGVIVTIERHPLVPLAMGNHSARVKTWRKRGFEQVPECNGEHDDGAIRAGEPECTACAGDNFNGDDAALVASIEALLALDERGVLVPHGIGGHARTLLRSAAARLAARPAAAESDDKQIDFLRKLEAVGFRLAGQAANEIEAARAKECRA
jgi:hypothetical protein